MSHLGKRTASRSTCVNTLSSLQSLSQLRTPLLLQIFHARKPPKDSPIQIPVGEEKYIFVFPSRYLDGIFYTPNAISVITLLCHTTQPHLSVATYSLDRIQEPKCICPLSATYLRSLRSFAHRHQVPRTQMKDAISMCMKMKTVIYTTMHRAISTTWAYLQLLREHAIQAPIPKSHLRSHLEITSIVATWPWMARLISSAAPVIREAALSKGKDQKAIHPTSYSRATTLCTV